MFIIKSYVAWAKQYLNCENRLSNKKVTAVLVPIFSHFFVMYFSYPCCDHFSWKFVITQKQSVITFLFLTRFCWLRYQFEAFFSSLSIKMDRLKYFWCLKLLLALNAPWSMILIHDIEEESRCHSCSCSFSTFLGFVFFIFAEIWKKVLSFVVLNYATDLELWRCHLHATCMQQHRL